MPTGSTCERSTWRITRPSWVRSLRVQARARFIWRAWGWRLWWITSRAADLRIDLRALDLADYPAELGAQFAGAGPGPVHLARVGVATLLHYEPRAHSLVALLDLDAALPRHFHQAFPRPVVEPGIGRVANRLGLNGRVDVHPLDLCRRDHLHPHRRLDRLLEHRFRSGLTETVTPPRHARGIDRNLVLEKLLAAEVLPIGIFNPVLYHTLSAQVVLIFQVVQRHHEARAHPGRSARHRVRLPQSLFEDRPINLPAQLHERVSLIHQPLQFDSKKFTLRLADRRLWLHRIFPVLRTLVEGLWENKHLRYNYKLLYSNMIGILQDRLSYKLGWFGGELNKVNPAFTSQTCPQCGHVCADNRPARDRFKCIACGHVGHADNVAAMNILAAGLAVSARGGPQGPAKREPTP